MTHLIIVDFVVYYLFLRTIFITEEIFDFKKNCFIYLYMINIYFYLNRSIILIYWIKNCIYIKLKKLNIFANYYNFFGLVTNNISKKILSNICKLSLILLKLKIIFILLLYCLYNFILFFSITELFNFIHYFLIIFTM